jgi:hypothetical protein
MRPMPVMPAEPPGSVFPLVEAMAELALGKSWTNSLNSKKSGVRPDFPTPDIL